MNLDSLPPPEMACKAEEVGVAKAGADTATTFALAVLAGAFIAMGAVFATTTTAGTGDLPYGVVRLLAGLTFSLGLILVVVAGAELFTGNNLIVMAWASRRVSTVRLARNWAIVYAGNAAGALATAGIVYAAKQYEFGKGAVGVQALSIGAGKTSLGFVQAVALGALQRARLPRRLALLQRAHDRRPDPRDRAADRGLRCLGLRAQRREHVLRPVRALRQGERLVRRFAKRRSRPFAPDVGPLPRRKSPSGHPPATSSAAR
jgi:hypothetical protein